MQSSTSKYYFVRLQAALRFLHLIVIQPYQNTISFSRMTYVYPTLYESLHTDKSEVLSIWLQIDREIFFRSVLNMCTAEVATS